MLGTCNSSLQLRAISEEHVSACNALYSAPLVVETSWFSSKWAFRFQHTAKPDIFPVQIIADWSGAKVIVRSSFVWLMRLTASFAGGTDIELLPKLLQIALAEAAFSELIEKIESYGKRQLRIESVLIDKDPSTAENEFIQMNGLQWQAKCDGIVYDGEIWLDCTGLEQAAELHRLKKLHRCFERSWAALPVPIRFIVGQTILSSEAYLSLELNDVVLLDEYWLTEEGILTAALGHGIAFRGRIDGVQLIVMEGIRRMMDDPRYDEQLDPYTEENSLISALPIKLTFDLGERTLKIGELQSLQPGYVFDLGRDLRQAVIIRANGVHVGEGELVDISGRTGVVVLSLSGKHE